MWSRTSESVSRMQGGTKSATREGYEEDGGKVGVESGLAEASSASYWQTDRLSELKGR